jgi:hypothetical protein
MVLFQLFLPPFEAMAEVRDRGGWRWRAEALAIRLRQEEALVRALPCAWP